MQTEMVNIKRMFEIYHKRTPKGVITFLSGIYIYYSVQLNWSRE